jgi:hypothetical protein
MAKAPKGWEWVGGGGRKRPIRPGRRSAPAGKKRLFVKEKTEARIRTIIEEWTGPTITWELIVKAVNAEFEGAWTRVAIAKHPKLQTAFTKKKDELRELALKRSTGRKRRQGDGTLDVMKRQIRSLQEDNAKLKGIVAKHEEKFATWKANAYLNGWPIRLLDKKPDKPDRGQSDKDR